MKKNQPWECSFEQTEEKVKGGNSILQSIWQESLDAELDGDLTLALEIHAQIIFVVGQSYSACQRAGWLHYQAGGFRQALMFYSKASDCSPMEAAPLFGAMACNAALGEYGQTRSWQKN